MTKTIEMDKRRSKLFSLILWLNIFASAVMTIRLLFPSFLKSGVVQVSESPSISIIRGLLAAITLVALFGIWKWKKWGVYLIALTIAVQYLVTLLNEDIKYLPLMIIPLSIDFLIYYFVIRPAWKNFD